MVDNDQLTLTMLALLIRESLPGAEVKRTCRNGREAIDRCLATNSRPDVLLVVALVGG